MICLEEIKLGHQGELASCNHNFCFVCIDNWATKSGNLCPLCRKIFTEISY